MEKNKALYTPPQPSYIPISFAAGAALEYFGATILI